MCANKTFDPFSFSNHLVGYDRMFDRLQEMTSNTAKVMTTNYPPYNIKKVDDNKYEIEMAVAGFGKQNIDIEIVDNTLTVKGGLTLDQLDPGNPVQYLFKGIADRAFTRQFSLADTVEIKDAHLINGMLKIILENIIPEHKKPRKVEIKDEESGLSTDKKLLTENDKNDNSI